MGEIRNGYRILFWKPVVMRSISKPRCIWEDNINTDLQQEEWNWIHMAQDRAYWRAAAIMIIYFGVL
jgi:hypothetical protein